jgi:hypothetical protein
MVKRLSQEDYKRISGRVLGANTEIYNRAVDALKPFNSLDTSSKEKKAKQVVDIFTEWTASNQIVVSPMPTKIQQAVITRMQNQLLADTIAQQACVISEVNWGESIVYKKKTRNPIAIKKIGEMGGLPQVIVGGGESHVDLGMPEIYTTDEFAVPIFNPLHPMKYLEELEDLATWAAQDLANTIDTDVWTALEAQIEATWTQADVFSYVNDRIKDVPTGNSIDISGETDGSDHLTRLGFQDLLLHGQYMGRTLRTLWIPTGRKADIWNWVSAVASSQGFTNLSQALQQELEATGGAVISLWGEPPVRVNSTNILDSDDTTVYGYALYEPTADRISPRGASILYWATSPTDNLVSPLVHINRRVERGGVFDYFVMQQGLLIASLGYQEPNFAKFKIKG